MLRDHFDKKNAIYEVEHRLKMKNGSWYWILDRGRVVDWTCEGQPIRMVGVHVDVHEQRKIRDQLKEADRRKDEFIATLAHELRNPLAPIRTGLQIIKRDPTSSAAQTARDMMDRQLAHLVRLIDDILDVSRITLGRLELKKELVTIGVIIDTAVEGSRPFIESEKHSLTVSNPEPGLQVFGDLTRLAQIVSNLLNNAAKYTPPGGSIDLRVEHTENEIVIRVHDTGLGIPADLLDKIFEMFSQVNKTLDRAQGGVGIGLALVRQLVELHGGRVIAESPGIGKGSTFTVILPMADAVHEAQTATQSTTTEPSTAASRRVLVVDDNLDAAESLAMFIRMLGHTPTVVHTGREALAELEHIKPEVVFLDIGLPEMDGYEVARRIREMPVGKNTYLVALTGWGGLEDKRRTREAGFDEHLTKPADLSVIERILSSESNHQGGGVSPEYEK
jgi:signal transduction histidine kinase/CheY-like chemotaxis protein